MALPKRVSASLRSWAIGELVAQRRHDLDQHHGRVGLDRLAPVGVALAAAKSSRAVRRLRSRGPGSRPGSPPAGRGGSRVVLAVEAGLAGLLEVEQDRAGEEVDLRMDETKLVGLEAAGLADLDLERDPFGLSRTGPAASAVRRSAAAPRRRRRRSPLRAAPRPRRKDRSVAFTGIAGTAPAATIARDGGVGLDEEEDPKHGLHRRVERPARSRCR